MSASAPSAPGTSSRPSTGSSATPPVAHLDLYRLNGLDPSEWGDLEPYFDGTVAFVEWPEHGGDWLPEARAVVTLGHVDELHRTVRIHSDLGL